MQQFINQLTEEQAIEFSSSGIWKDWSADQITRFQLYQDCLCMDFGTFREAVKESLGRDVSTYEFAYPDLLRQEFEGMRDKPTF